jgi:hypothetical protein
MGQNQNKTYAVHLEQGVDGLEVAGSTVYLVLLVQNLACKVFGQLDGLGRHIHSLLLFVLGQYSHK